MDISTRLGDCVTNDDDNIANKNKKNKTITVIANLAIIWAKIQYVWLSLSMIKGYSTISRPNEGTVESFTQHECLFFYYIL